MKVVFQELLIVLIVSGVAWTTPTNYAANKCPTLVEVFKVCGNPCQATCTNRSPACEFKCSRGCYCPYGQLRDANWRCVLPENC